MVNNMTTLLYPASNQRQKSASSHRVPATAARRSDRSTKVIFRKSIKNVHWVAVERASESMLDKGFAQTTLELKNSLLRPITPQTGLVRAGQASSIRNPLSMRSRCGFR
jgi:hypothetical protein